MTQWAVPAKYSRSAKDALAYLRFSLGSNVVFQKSRGNSWTPVVVVRDAVEDRVGALVVKNVRVSLKLDYELSKSGTRFLIDGPPVAAFRKELRMSVRSIGDVSQRALLPNLFRKLVEVPAVLGVMNPLRAILLTLRDDGTVAPSADFLAHYDPAKVKRYFGLLSDLDFVQSEGEQYVPGPGMMRLGQNEADSAGLISRVLGEALRRSYTYMTEVLGWKLMVPYLRWSNAYYWKALEADRLPVLDKDSWSRSHLQLYGRATHGNPATQIDDIVARRIVDRVTGGFRGVPEVFDPYKGHALEIAEVRKALSLAS